MNIGIICYVSRSGSTLLSRWLSLHSPDIVVVPELRTAEALLVEARRLRESSPKEVVRILMRDRRILEYLSEGKLQEIAGGDRDVVSLLTGIGRALAEKQGKEPRLVLLKAGDLALLRPDVMSHLGGIKVLHIYRDPRAVVNSTLRAQAPGRRMSMGRGSPLFLARRWQGYMDAMRLFKRGGAAECIGVAYEDLVCNGDAELRRILDALECRYHGARASWEYSVASREVNIHRLVWSPPDQARVEGWKGELGHHRGLLVEETCARGMKELGYSMWFSLGASRVERETVRAYYLLSYALEAIGHYGDRVVYYFSRPAGLLQRMRVQFSRRRLF